MAPAFAMNSYLGKQVLALVRDGDFAHAGEEEAIELCMSAVPKDPNQSLLDAGCGRGGTAAYLQQHGWGRVTGVDIEPQLIGYAREAHSDVGFVACDITDAAAHLDILFDVMTLFNVFYLLPDQAGALRSLASVAKPGARLMIFDYVDTGTYQDAPVLESSGPLLPRPLQLSVLPEMLSDAGWQQQDVQEVPSEYERWYADLVGRIENKRADIEALGGTGVFDHVHGLYSDLLAALRDGRLSGAIIHAQR